ncbi:MAG: hypothetical protein U1C55_04595 [Smithellaceae bacterium]|nr:hypothetical protein [Smithellaceae bacterium]
MATRKAREIKEGLTKKGFIPVQRDHTYLFFSVEGQKSGVRTKISHGRSEYGDNLLSFVARELHLSRKQLDDLLDCPLSYEDYLSMLKEKKIIVI